MAPPTMVSEAAGGHQISVILIKHNQGTVGHSGHLSLHLKPGIVTQGNRNREAKRQ